MAAQNWGDAGAHQDQTLAPRSWGNSAADLASTFPRCSPVTFHENYLWKAARKKKKQSHCHLSFSSGCRTCVQERKAELQSFALVSAKLQDNKQGYAGNEKACFFALGGSLDRRCQRSLTTLFLFPECCSASRGRRDLLSHSEE